MNIREFLSPILRQKSLLMILWGVFVLLFWGLSTLVPVTTKSTIYFSVKPLAAQTETASQSIITDPAQSAEKLAETIAGWAKDPGFRQEILDDAGIYIGKFKRKISARKQNRMNVFWTLKLTDEEQKHTEVLTQSTRKTLENTIANYNENSIFPLQITAPRTFIEKQVIPFWWLLVGFVIVGFFLSGILIYVRESFQDRVSFPVQVKDLFPSIPTLEISKKIGSHDERLLEQFILTFDSPRLVGTFPKAEKFFSLAPRDSIDEERDTPVLLVKLGRTKVTELKNLVAIFGNEIGIVIFKS